MPRHSAETGKIGSEQRWRSIQKHAGRSSIDRKTVPHLSDPRYLLKCDALSCEEVIKTVLTSPGRNKELRPVRDFSPSMLLYGALSLFRTNFPHCHALLCFVTSSLASPIMPEFQAKLLQRRGCRHANHIFHDSNRIRVAARSTSFYHKCQRLHASTLNFHV